MGFGNYLRDFVGYPTSPWRGLVFGSLSSLRRHFFHRFSGVSRLLRRRPLLPRQHHHYHKQYQCHPSSSLHHLFNQWLRIQTTSILLWPISLVLFCFFFYVFDSSSNVLGSYSYKERFKGQRPEVFPRSGYCLTRGVTRLTWRWFCCEAVSGYAPRVLCDRTGRVPLADQSLKKEKLRATCFLSVTGSVSLNF